MSADGSVTADAGVAVDGAPGSDVAPGPDGAVAADLAPAADTAMASGKASGTMTGTVTINGVTEDFNCNLADNPKASNAHYTAAASLLSVSCATSQGILTLVGVGMPAVVGPHPQALAVINNNASLQRYTTQFYGLPLGADDAHPTYTNTVTSWDEASLHLTGESEATFAMGSAPGSSGAFKVKFDVVVVKQ
jgi:hypothetical protein